MPKRAPIALVPPPSDAPVDGVAGDGSGRSRSPAPSGRAKAREGTRLVGAHVPMAVWRELHVLRGELGVTMQALLVEAIEDVVGKHRRR